jgi:hypothetical protein
MVMPAWPSSDGLALGTYAAIEINPRLSPLYGDSERIPR